jgi:4-methylaminobutanoate oxidase (formaldehyde-forming)
VTFTIDDPEPLIYHSEPIHRSGVHAGEDTHGAYAHQLGCAIGMTYLHNPKGVSDEWIRDGKYEISVAGKRYPITIHQTPPYDPKGERVRM